MSELINIKIGAMIRGRHKPVRRVIKPAKTGEGEVEISPLLQESGDVCNYILPVVAVFQNMVAGDKIESFVRSKGKNIALPVRGFFENRALRLMEVVNAEKVNTIDIHFAFVK